MIVQDRVVRSMNAKYDRPKWMGYAEEIPYLSIHHMGAKVPLSADRRVVRNEKIIGWAVLSVGAAGAVFMLGTVLGWI